MNWLYNVNSNKGYLSLWYQVCSTAKNLHFTFLASRIFDFIKCFHSFNTNKFFLIYLFLFKRLMGFCHFSSLAASQRAARRAFLFFNRSSFQYRWHGMKGPRNKKGERHKRKCNLNSKHSSVMRQWVTAMGAQTLKDTFKSLHATLGTWASTCCRNIRLKAAVWEARGIQSDFLPTLISLIT